MMGKIHGGSFAAILARLAVKMFLLWLVEQGKIDQGQASDWIALSGHWHIDEYEP